MINGCLFILAPYLKPCAPAKDTIIKKTGHITRCARNYIKHFYEAY